MLVLSFCCGCSPSVVGAEDQTRAVRLVWQALLLEPSLALCGILPPFHRCRQRQRVTWSYIVHTLAIPVL